ncbi:MAG: flagellar hook-length control protein FliK [Pseudomonadota bacterium]
MFPVSGSGQIDGARTSSDTDFEDILSRFETDRPSTTLGLKGAASKQGSRTLGKEMRYNLVGGIRDGVNSPTSGTSASSTSEGPGSGAKKEPTGEELLGNNKGESGYAGNIVQAIQTWADINSKETIGSTGAQGVSFLDNALKDILLKAGIGQRVPGGSTSGQEILKDLLLEAGMIRTESGEMTAHSGNQVLSLLANDTLREMLLKAGIGQRGLELLQEKLGDSLSKGDMLRGLLTELSTESERLSVLSENYGISASREEIIRAILVKLGMDPQQAKIFVERGRYGQAGSPENDSVGVRFKTIQDLVDFLNDRVPVPESSQANLNSPEGKSVPRTGMEERILSQIVEKVSTSVNNGRNEVVMELKPDFLGRLHIRISIQDQYITARILTESPVTKDIIEANSHLLKLSLLEHGLKVDKFSVFVGYNQNQFSQDYERPSFGNAGTSHNSEGAAEPGAPEGEDVLTPTGARVRLSLIDFFA